MGRRDTNLLLDAAVQAAAAKAVQASATLRFAQVTAVDTGARTLTVQLGEREIPGVPYMASYAAPDVDDVAWLLHQDSVLIAIGKR